MRPTLCTYICLVVLAALALAGCAKSDKQREFENEAFSTPQGITEMTANGRLVDGGNVDSDDWRIGPQFQGLIRFASPAVGAYPNPVNLNGDLTIEVDIIGFESIMGLEILVFSDPGMLSPPIYVENQTNLSPGVKVITLDPGLFSQVGQGSGASGIYRLLIYDGRQNLISYGDVEVQ